MAFKIKSMAERNAHIYEGATIFWRPVLYARQLEIEHACTERGVLDMAKKNLMSAQDAVVGWDEQVHDADDTPLAVPTGTEDERRHRIALIVGTFPMALIIQLGILACADNPEAIKKSWEILSLAAFASPIDTPAESLPVPTADSNEPRTA